MITSAVVPRDSAASSLPCSSCFRCRAVRRIQKTIHVTRHTAMIDREPPRASCAVNVSVCEPNWSAAPKANDSTTASVMPIQTGRSASSGPVFAPDRR